MNVQDYLKILKRRLIPILAVGIVIALAAILVQVWILTPTYTARTTLNVMIDVSIKNYGLNEDYTNRLLNTYAYIVESTLFREKVVALLPQRSAAVLESRDSGTYPKVDAEVIPDTALLLITVQDPDAALAKDLAGGMGYLIVRDGQNILMGASVGPRQVLEKELTTMASDLLEKRQKLSELRVKDGSEAEIKVLETQIQSAEESYANLMYRYVLEQASENLQTHSVTVVSPAALTQSIPGNFTFPGVGLALVLGLVSSLGAAWVIDKSDTRIHSQKQLERLTDLPILGVVPGGLIPPLTNGHLKNSHVNRLADSYRLLAVNIQSYGQDRPNKSILITSPVPTPGKSIVSTNLAQILSERNEPVYLVEGNLRSPMIGKLFQIENNPGLTNILSKRTGLTQELSSKVITPIQEVCFGVISGGSKVENSTALLASPRMSELMDYLASKSKIILVDAPSILDSADVSILATIVNQVVIVVEESSTTLEQLQASVKQMLACRASILGLIFLRKE